MKTKNILIVLFIMLFAGAILMGSCRAEAACSCEPEELANNSCIDIPGYAVRISPVTPGGPWPIVCDPNVEPPENADYCLFNDQATSTYLDWRWEVCTTSSNCKKDAPETWGYFLHRIESGVVPKIIGSKPTGAQLVLPGDPNKCGLTVADENHVLWKLNPSVNCLSASGIVKFSMYTEPGLFAGICNMSAATLKNECYGNYLQGPATDATLPVEEYRQYCYGDGGNPRIEVTYDKCSGEPVVGGVLIDGVTVNPTTAYFATRNDDGTYSNLHQVSACGSGAGGCYICTERAIYIDGYNVYFGPAPPSP